MPRYVCLLGNGASIPYAIELGVENLTASLIDMFMEMGATDAGKALHDHAIVVQGHDAAGFEDLLGPLEGAAQALPYLNALAPLSNALTNDDIRNALTTVQGFVSELHRLGLGITLEHIADYAHANPGQFEVAIMPLALALSTLDPDLGNITVASLNYDGLTHAGLMHANPIKVVDPDTGQVVNHRLCDMADGRNYEEVQWDDVPVEQPAPLSAVGLRTDDSTPPGRVTLIQLHGSLGWLSHPVHGAWRFDLQHLRDGGYWQRFRDGNTNWAPLVVLTDKKDPLVREWPFALAYSMFTNRLIHGERWLVVGYGWGDRPVNQAFRKAYTAKPIGQREALRILIIDYNENPTAAVEAALREQVCDEIGIPIAQVTVDLSGSPAFVNNDSFADWRTWP